MLYAGLIIAAIGGIGVLKAVGSVGGTNYTEPTPTADSQPTHGMMAQRNNTQFAPDFTLPNIKGGSITLSDFRGEKPVILDFFATWCHNCERAMPKLSKLYEEYKDDVEIIGVNLRENKRTVEKFINKRNISYPIVLDSGTTSRTYNVRYTNTHVLVRKDGSILRVVPGDLNENHIKSLIE